jgi:hypothetical protein
VRPEPMQSPVAATRTLHAPWAAGAALSELGPAAMSSMVPAQDGVSDGVEGCKVAALVYLGFSSSFLGVHVHVLAAI